MARYSLSATIALVCTLVSHAMQNTPPASIVVSQSTATVNVPTNPFALTEQEIREKTYDKLPTRLIDPVYCKHLITTASPLLTDKIKALAEADKHPNDQPITRLLLHGPSGSGKTTTVHALCQYTGISCTSLEGPFISNSCKDSGQEKLKETFERLSADASNRHVLFIDELNALTDAYSRPNDHDKAAVQAFWLMLDKTKDLKNICVITASNEVNNLPDQIRTRFRNAIVEVKLPQTNATRENVLRFHLQRYTSNITENFIKTFLKKTKHLSPRDISEMLEEAQRHTSQHYPNKKNDKNEIITLHQEALDHCLKLQQNEDRALDSSKPYNYWKLTRISLGITLTVLEIGLHLYPLLAPLIKKNNNSDKYAAEFHDLQKASLNKVTEAQLQAIREVTAAQIQSFKIIPTAAAVPQASQAITPQQAFNIGAANGVGEAVGRTIASAVIEPFANSLKEKINEKLATETVRHIPAVLPTGQQVQSFINHMLGK